MGFVISYVRGVRRLHEVGRCANKPGQRFKNFTVCGPVRPPRDSYDQVCLACWPPQSDSSSSDTSDSSSEAESGSLLGAATPPA